MLTTFFVIYLIQGLLGGVPEPSKYILSFPTHDNPLNITVATAVEKNYIITIGDWGANKDSLEDRAVQKKVADIMNSFYESQKAKGMNLLFVAAVGDNFYWTGQNCKEWDTYWRDIYGPNLTAPHIPWLSVYGNHDWADKDEFAMCAWNNTKYIDPITSIPYAADQLNQDKGGCNPSNYYLPDFSYYYTINSLNFEFIAMEETYHYCPSEVGGGHGNDNVWKNCEEDGKGHENGKTVGCNYLGKINNASENMLINRAKISNGNKNILISQHYPEEGKRLVDTFKANINNQSNINNYNVWSVYGHVHNQKCDRYNKNGECDAILSGGGGGCCNFEFTTRGIYVIGFDKNGKMIQPYNFTDDAISCRYPCDVDIDNADKDELMLETCCHTNDATDVDCSTVDIDACYT